MPIIFGSEYWGQDITSITIDVPFCETRHKQFRQDLSLLSTLPGLSQIHLRFPWKPVDTLILTRLLEPLANIQCLRSLQLNGWENFDEVVAALPSLPELKSFETHSSFVLSQRGLDQLQKFPGLESILFSNKFVEIQNMDAVAALPNLKELSFLLVVPPDPTKSFTGHPTLQRFEGDLSDELLSLLGTCPNLRSICAFTSTLTDKGLSYLNDLHHLQSINLERSFITDEGFSCLARHKSLRYIKFCRCRITDAIGATLEQLKELEQIHFYNTLVTSNLIHHLQGLPKLSDICLGDAPIHIDMILPIASRMPPMSTNMWRYPRWQEAYYRLSNDSTVTLPYDSEYLCLPNLRGLQGRVAQLRGLSGIVYAFLENTDIDKADLQALTSACQLWQLDITETAVTAEAIAALANQKGLTRLRIGPFDDPSSAIATISKLTSLESLCLNTSNRLTADDLAPLLNLPNLRHVSLDNHPYDEQLVILLCQLPRLESAVCGNYFTDYRKEQRLRLEPFPLKNISPPSLRERLKANPDLQIATIAEESDLQYVSDNFDRICVSGVKLTEKGIARLTQHPQLTGLNLSNTGINDKSLKVLLSSFPKLAHLDLSANNLTDQAVPHLLHLQNLKSLNLSNTRIGNPGLTRIFQSLSLEFLDLSDTDITENAWLQLAPGTKLKCQEIKLDNVDSLPNILKTIPLEFLKCSLNCRMPFSELMIRVLRGDESPSSLAYLCITPELLRAWNAKDLFDGKTALTDLYIYATGQASRLLELAQQVSTSIKLIELHDESLTSQPSFALPKELKTASFYNCILDSETLLALGQCRSLNELELTDCKLDNTSLEPLLQLPQLSVLNLYATPLNTDQLATIHRVRPNLIQSNVRR